MRRLATSEQMKNIDYTTINEIGIPSLVLMENAGKEVFKECEKYGKDKKF